MQWIAIADVKGFEALRCGGGRHYSANIYARRAVKAREPPLILNAPLVTQGLGGSTWVRVTFPLLEAHDTPLS